jgi:hypothetical protein
VSTVVEDIHSNILEDCSVQIWEENITKTYRLMPIAEGDNKGRRKQGKIRKKKKKEG